ncbi:DNA ligase 3 isoform X3 [Cimex lectularius]|uniref:DNA ligase n=1 Tax=Cimex lectularius TaxID=79782 RepID=A0A8I6TDV1_CIMLE|nr:DNA ligase 3 isoform X3 [Cimex lectularius]
MSDQEESADGSTKEYKFYADRAKTGRAGCRKCKQKIEPQTLRLAKVGPSPFGSGLMKLWHHLDCMFEVFSKQRATTAKIEFVDDIGGWDALTIEDKKAIMQKLPESAKTRSDGGDPLAAPATGLPSKSPSKDKKNKAAKNKSDPNHKDNSLREFRRLCANISNVPGYLDKTGIVKEFITKGTDGESYKGDLLLLIRLLLPGVIKRVYNLQSKQIVKLFSRIFGTDWNEMLEHLEQGDVAETIREFFEKSARVKPVKTSFLTNYDVDEFLEQLTKLTKEQDQIDHFSSISSKCTSNDLKMIVRLVKHDLRINAGAKHILDAVDENAYQAFQASRDINSIIKTVDFSDKKDKKGQSMNVDINILTPVLPMLAQACKSAEEALKKCSNGIFSEIKYDGERVQVHKKGNIFKYYSRSLKPILRHKIDTFEQCITQAFPTAVDLILDSEILMIDTNTGKPLPFGSLGVHKRNAYRDANVCLFVFDCIYFNGKSLLKVPLCERKKILHDNMTEIPFKILFSEAERIHDVKALEVMMASVIKQGLEGLVLKDMESIYEPGKRHWLKMKKDYLSDGALADSADLVVLGAWYGTGKKGGKMSVFLMGCFDEKRDIWCTVTKVHTGLDDKTLDKLQNELDMVKIGKESRKVPSWLDCTKTMIPDFVARDPKKQPVWEIRGAEFTKHDVHTADGISIRFPRIVRIREDKNWETATTLEHLNDLFTISKQHTDITFGEHSPAQKRSADKTEDEGQAPATKKAKYKIKNPLPDVFVGMKICLPAGLPEKRAKTIQRYFIAYGGKVVDSIPQASHKIVDKVVDGDPPECITLEEILKSIREKRLVSRTISTKKKREG